MLTFQLINNDESVANEAVTAEEKWILYMDHFIQLSNPTEIADYSNAGVLSKSLSSPSQSFLSNHTYVLKRRLPFLRRNLPSLDSTSLSPSSALKSSLPLSNTCLMRFGLEIKICVNTYKIFWVENTEDFYCRIMRPILKDNQKVAMNGKKGNGAIYDDKKRVLKFRRWLSTKK